MAEQDDYNRWNGGVKGLAYLLGCSVGSFTATYLGLLLRVAHRPDAVWDSVEEHFKLRLVPWKKQYLFGEGGKWNLLKAPPQVLWSISCPYCHLQERESQLRKDPKGFLVRDNLGRRKMNVMELSVMFADKKNGDWKVWRSKYRFAW